jgi:hypothetical protein
MKVLEPEWQISRPKTFENFDFNWNNFQIGAGITQLKVWRSSVIPSYILLE